MGPLCPVPFITSTEKISDRRHKSVAPSLLSE